MKDRIGLGGEEEFLAKVPLVAVVFEDEPDPLEGTLEALYDGEGDEEEIVLVLGIDIVGEFVAELEACLIRTSGDGAEESTNPFDF